LSIFRSCAHGGGFRPTHALGWNFWWTDFSRLLSTWV
jgi:hypothetical protein